MTLICGKELPEEFSGGIVTIGNFDGVHRGHQEMLSVLKRIAGTVGVPSVVMTFDPHPLELLRPHDVPPRLTMLQRKADLLTQHGVDAVLAYPTDRSLLSRSPAEFFTQIVVDRLHARGVVEGPNFCFGRDRAGDVDTLRQLCDESGLSCEVVVPVVVDDDLISSSKIRAQIVAGNVNVAADWLGHNYRVTGTVARGAGRGASVGFPTANLENVETLIPANGVYAGRAFLGEEMHTAAVNVGTNPTFGDARQKLEVHLLDYEGDLYDREFTLEFLTRIRDVVEFKDAAELQTQIDQDLKEVRAVAEKRASR